MANPLKEKLIDHAKALKAHRDELAARYAAEIATLDARLQALQDLAAQWDTLTVDQALTKLNATGIQLEIK